MKCRRPLIEQNGLKSRNLLRLASVLVLVLVPIAGVDANDDFSRIKKRLVVEASAAELIQTQTKSYHWLTLGLNYAASKLCPGPELEKLQEINKGIGEKLVRLQKSNSHVSAIVGSATKHLGVAQQHVANPLRFRLELSLAKDELENLIEQNRDRTKQLAKVHDQIIRSEAQYQQVLADCLLGDFMSIFGTDESPSLEPDVPDDMPDDVPDELLDFFFQEDPEFDIDQSDLPE